MSHSAAVSRPTNEGGGRIATLTRLLISDARLVTDGGGKVPAALNVIEGADHVAAFLAGVVRKGWTDGCPFASRRSTASQG